MLKLSRQGAVGFIDWLDELPSPTSECDRNIDLFPLSGLPLPLAKRFHRVLIQCRSSRRFDHCDFAHRTRPYIKRDSEEAASCTWRDHLASDLPCSQFIRIVGSALLDRVSHPRHPSNIIASTMSNTFRLHGPLKPDATSLKPKVRQP